MKKEVEIIIAEDQKLFRDNIITALEEFNISTVAEAENGIELLQALKLKTPDVVLLDIEMPLKDGCETLKAITEEFPGTKVIMLSQYDNSTLIKNYISRGAKAYFTKNTDIEILAQGIRAVKVNGFYYDNIQHVFENKKNGFGKNNAFSGREMEIIDLMCKGKSTKQIAGDLNVVIKTIEAHRKDIYNKTNTLSLPAFIAYAVKEGLNYLRKI